MRLREKEKKIILKAIRHIDPEARIFLFGSRVDDTRRGGDIDILILTEKMTYDDKLAVKKEFFHELEEQKIDIVISKHGEEPFVKMIFEQGIELQ